jgi:hypothetical protein
MLTLTINAKMPPIFTQCVQIVESGLISVLASCCWGRSGDQVSCYTTVGGGVVL